VGRVIKITPDATSCNVQLVVLDATTLPDDFQPADHNLYQEQRHVMLVPVYEGAKAVWTRIRMVMEYGQCDHFLKIACWLLALAVVMAIASPAEARVWRSRAWSQPTQLAVTPVQYRPATSPLDRKVDGSDHYNADLVTDLPQDEGKLYLTLIVSEPMDERQQQIAEWFTRDPRLVHFRSQCHWNFYSTTNPHFTDRLYHRVGAAVPIVCMQKPDGEVLLNVTARSMPRTAGELADMINDAVQVRYAPPDFRDLAPSNTPTIIRESDCPDDNCPAPSPNVSPPSGPIVPEVLPTPPVSGLLVGVVVIGGLVIGGGLVLIFGLVVGAMIAFMLRRPSRSELLL
jgi:hypothetical protein